MNNIGILLPAYNEEKNIAAVIKEAKRSLPSAQIIVVNDGSSDRTSEIARKLNVLVVDHTKNMGKGEALRTGLDIFNRDFRSVKYIVVADADRQYSIREANRLLKPLIGGEADFVMGKRDFSTVPARHRLGNWVWRNAFNLWFKTNYPDTNCGFIAMTKEAANAVMKTLGGGYIIETTLLTQAIKRGFRVSHVGVSVTYTNTSGVLRGVLMVAGVLVFIFKNGMKYSRKR
ncbi:MAG: glycosyltransferase family 2 protein [Candidatus Aenigmarchaeota archaeon]|nr:glycosyltransferase family 2 protein [Candidatus Aenigmarchaeota archaeon]